MWKYKPWTTCHCFSSKWILRRIRCFKWKSYFRFTWWSRLSNCSCLSDCIFYKLQFTRKCCKASTRWISTHSCGCWWNWYYSYSTCKTIRAGKVIGTVGSEAKRNSFICWSWLCNLSSEWRFCRESQWADKRWRGWCNFRFYFWNCFGKKFKMSCLLRPPRSFR